MDGLRYQLVALALEVVHCLPDELEARLGSERALVEIVAYYNEKERRKEDKAVQDAIDATMADQRATLKH